MTGFQNDNSPNPIDGIDKLWRACNYIATAMIFLRDNVLLRRPLQHSDLKERLIGHWGSSPGLSFIYCHLNWQIIKRSCPMIFIAGPGHGAPGVIAPVFLEKGFEHYYPKFSADEAGLKHLCQKFSFPGGLGSHCTPELPGSIHEGGELGYSLSHAFGAAFDNPKLVVSVVVGDGEAETGPLATAWHSNKFLNPIRDGAVLPFLHLNGYKINNPTLLSRIGNDELTSLFRGYGWTPIFVEGYEPDKMHIEMASALSAALDQIEHIQLTARQNNQATRAHWPMIILRSPKGWTGPKYSYNHKLEGFWRSHQVPLKSVHTDTEQFTQLADWLSSYKPDELFDQDGKLLSAISALIPDNHLKMSLTPDANAGRIKKPLHLPNSKDFCVSISEPGQIFHSNTQSLGAFCSSIMDKNPTSFRVFSPDENSSNKLDDIYSVSKKLWLANYLPEDADGGELSPSGRVLEMLSEHTVEGWLEGYLLTGRHGLISTYEAFVHVIDSMFNQHAKWLEVAKDIKWRPPIASLNMLITSTVWRQDHNGFTHQDPGFISLVLNKSPEVVRAYFPPDANCLLHVMEKCFRSENLINVVTCDKQAHLQYLSYDQAKRHVLAGIGKWSWASTDDKNTTDVVLACCGDVPTKEVLAATKILITAFPDLKIRVINVVDLFTLASEHTHPKGLSDLQFDSLFPANIPVIFNFHGYPWIIHRLTYKRHNHQHFHVRGYQERGNINTPLELAIINKIDRFSLAIETINRVPALQSAGLQLKQELKEQQQSHIDYAHKHGVDSPEINQWRW